MNFFKGPFVSKCKKTMEYIPLTILFTLMFVAETEIDHNIIRSSWNIVLTFILLILIYVMMIVFKIKNKPIIMVTVVVIWAIFIYIKNCVFIDKTG